ncbi:MAG: hypothetical protein DBX39_01375 [Bacillota bacterium]|nr:MAG: hypothetical protein DBX39_01375 [Bacillota bacterium]
MVTKRDVAVKAGVSTATVSRVISGQGYVSGEAEKKVLRAIDELKYIPNKLASNLAKKESNVIAVLVEDLLNPYYMHLVDAMVERAAEKNYIVSLFALKNRKVKCVLDDLATNRVCGIVNLAMFTCDFSAYDVFIESGTRLINCTNADPSVVVDYEPGMMEALQLLHEKGCRDVAFISGLEEWLTYKDRRVNCYLNNLERFGFTRDERLLLSGNYPKEKAHKVGYELCEQLLQSGVRFDSIFCLTDMMSLGVMKALYDHGYKIPEDVSIIGSDNLDFAHDFHPALTTIDVDKKAEGYAYVDFILGECDQEIVKIKTKLVVRDSVKK